MTNMNLHRLESLQTFRQMELLVCLRLVSLHRLASSDRSE